MNRTPFGFTISPSPIPLHVHQYHLAPAPSPSPSPSITITITMVRAGVLTADCNDVPISQSQWTWWRWPDLRLEGEWVMVNGSICYAWSCIGSWAQFVVRHPSIHHTTTIRHSSLVFPCHMLGVTTDDLRLHYWRARTM